MSLLSEDNFNTKFNKDYFNSCNAPDCVVCKNDNNKIQILVSDLKRLEDKLDTILNLFLMDMY